MALLPSFPDYGPFAGLQLGDHLCLPVGSDAERLAGTAGLTDLGLRSGVKVIVYPHTETPQAMAAYLTARVPDARAALTAGRLVILACRDVYVPDGAFDADRTMASHLAQLALAEEQGYPGVWAAVDMAWSLSGVAEGSLVAYEAAANPAFADHRVAAVCVYDRTRFSPALIERACWAHPLTPGQAPLRFAWTIDPPGLALSGEVDLTNHGALSALLAPLHTVPGHITIDATGLLFADLRAADLLCGTCSARDRGTTTITGSSLVNRLLELASDPRPTGERQLDA